MQTISDILQAIANSQPTQNASFQAETSGRNWGAAPQSGLNLSGSFKKRGVPGTPGANTGTMAGGPQDANGLSSIGPLIAAMG